MAALNFGGGQHSGSLPNWREFARSVRGRFTLLTAALVLTAGLTAAFVALDNYGSQRRETERQLTETATALSLAVDGRMREANATLRSLATSPYLQTRDFAAFDRQARQLVNRPDVWIGVIDRRGQQVVNTRFASGTPLPNVRNEPEFQKAWEKASSLYISDLGQSGSMPRRYTLELATVVKIDGRPDYLLAMALPPAVLNELIAEQHLPDS
ncbi:cache domain-containing protein [Caulobacter sp. 17J65-9]|uniref:cache domain-containing protein n=1 Tax=Caulobacter sp. 17J65-9 TaxID=2709382 RepID=UPI0013CA9B3F|nr:cache domain-containing protein [Caulobacter sp. 17J65-9]NEX91759.1 hypothetical protein [Caulobacter sp. 17J65-9]